MKTRLLKVCGGAACVAASIVLGLAPSGAFAQGDDLGGSSGPQHIDSEKYVPECSWPSVVALGGNTEICSGNYIGGRVVLTAGHCLDQGFRVGIDGPCMSDDDCPTHDEFGVPYPQLECFEPGSDRCDAVDPNLSDSFTEARFGESYVLGEADGQARNAIHIEYCREYSTAVDPAAAADLAYCILQEEPNVQPIRIAAPCEVPPLRSMRDNHKDLMAVGFGQDANGESGRKQEAIGDMHQGFSGFGTLISMSDWDRVPRKGDSGGPLLIQLPDGTWRQLGTATKAFSYAGIWPRLAWMLQDPNVKVGDILPCHNEDGSWNPTPGCEGDPLMPMNPQGSWARGPKACFHNESPPSETCGSNGGAAGGSSSGGDFGSSGFYLEGDYEEDGELAAMLLEDEPHERRDAEPVPPSSTAAGCNTSGNGPGWMGLLGLLGLLGLRRRRVLVGALGCLLGMGCGDDGGDGGLDTDTGTGPDPTTGVDPSPVAQNLDFRRSLGGHDPDTSLDYTELAVGNVREAVGSSSCCQDYVLGSETSPNVRVSFSSDLRGVVFLDEEPDVLIDVGGSGVRDLALADVDEDGRNDLVVLLTSGDVSVVPGIPSSPYFDEAASSSFSPLDSGPTLVVRDVMCAGHLDILLPTDGGFSLWEGDGSGGFALNAVEATGHDARSADLGDLDHDALSSPDIVLGNDDGSVTLVRNGCEGIFEVQETEQLLGASLNVPEMQVVLGEFCPEYSNELAVAAGASSQGVVSVACGDGTGTIQSIPGAYGGTTPAVSPEIDYRWNSVQAQTLGAWPEAGLVQNQALYTMQIDAHGRSVLSRLLPTPGGVGGPYDAHVVDLAELEGEARYSELEIHRLTGQSGEMWHRAVFVGPEGFGAVQ